MGDSFVLFEGAVDAVVASDVAVVGFGVQEVEVGD